MRPESLVQLAASGNTAMVEEEWMRLAEAPDVPLERLIEYKDVLVALREAGNVAHAEELAWAAVEAVSARYSAREALTVAGAFLLAVGESDELRVQAMDLYRSAYADCDGLEELLSQAGLGGGRPVRRAIRTLDVCLNLREGDFLEGRNDDGAARVDKIDYAMWRFTVTSGGGIETLESVHVADRYRPASASDFRVMRIFAPDQFVRQLWDDPVPVIIDICKQHNNKIDSDTLETLLVAELPSEADWKKWWTRTRNVLRRCPHIKLDGRSPYTMTYVDRPIAPEDELSEKFNAARDPLAQLELVETYLHECKIRGQQPREDILRRCYEGLALRAEELTRDGVARAGLYWVISRQVAERGGLRGAEEGAVNYFKTKTDLNDIFREIEDDSLLDLACRCVVEAGPDDWEERLAALLPTLPLATCNQVAVRLVSAGRAPADFEPIVREIVSSPIPHFEALLWLWDGPSEQRRIPVPEPVTILSRIFRALDECRRSEVIPKVKTRKIAARARAVLSARKYERFDQCLDKLDPGMGRALKTQIRPLDALGVAVRGDLLGRLDRRFPARKSEPETPPWMRDDVLYVTKEGLTRKQEEIDHHVNVKMRENAVAIGRAAERGDLSENSEYKFALEERDLLRARLAQMNAEMAMASVVEPEDVTSDVVGFGARVILKRVTDADPYKMSILGPWEANLEERRFNYKTPLAQKVLGKRVGDIIEFEHTGATGAYEIIALENAMS